jgi:hypothetical protein
MIGHATSHQEGGPHRETTEQRHKEKCGAMTTEPLAEPHCHRQSWWIDRYELPAVD